MTHPVPPPAPLPRTPSSPARPVPIAKAAPTTSARPTSNSIDIQTLGAGTIRPGLNSPKERVLLAGDTNSGKSYAYMQVAQRHFEQGLPTKFWILDTDDTAPTFLAEGYEFEHLYFENGGNCYPFYSGDWPTLVKAANHVVRESSRDDWVILDLASSAYALAQYYIADLKGLNLNDEVARRLGLSTSGKKLGFGAFDSDTWALVTRTYEATMRPLVNSPKLNFIGLAHVTDMMTKAGRETREPILLFDQLGMKPTGVGKLVKMVNTAIVLWSVRPMDQDRNSSPTISRFMTVVKDRSEACHYTQHFTNCFEDLKTYRRTVAKTANVTDSTQANQMLETVHTQLAAMRNLENPDDINEDTLGATAETDGVTETEGA